MTDSFGSSSRHHHPTHCFAVTATAEPGAMSRVLEVFAKRGLVPSRCHGTLAGRDGDDLSIDIQLDGLDAALAARLAETLRQAVCVRAVLVSEKRRLLTA